MLGQGGCESDRENPVASCVPARFDQPRRRHPLPEVSEHRPRCQQAAMAIRRKEFPRRIGVVGELHVSYPPNASIGRLRSGANRLHAVLGGSDGHEELKRDLYSMMPNANFSA